jgi:hypothetical protein
MPDLTWRVRVHNWTWTYTFSHLGSVTWRDPFNGRHGSGSWRVQGDKLLTRWFGSQTWEEWDLPINPLSATGSCHMEEGTYDLWAEAQHYYLQPGDTLTVGNKKYVIYPDEVRSGGTVAWVCRNPGNIRSGEKYGAYKGKSFQTKSVGAFAIFPDEETGMRAIISVLKGYGHVTVAQAMHKYAPSGDGVNNPDKYGRTVAKGIGVDVGTYVDTLNDTQLQAFAAQIKIVEGWQEGDPVPRDSPKLPEELRQRLAPHLYPPTEDELRNSSIGR